MSHGVIPSGLAEGARGGMAPIARRLSRVGVTANSITFLGCALSIVGSGFVAAAQPVPDVLAVRQQIVEVMFHARAHHITATSRQRKRYRERPCIRRLPPGVVITQAGCSGAGPEPDADALAVHPDVQVSKSHGYQSAGGSPVLYADEGTASA